MKFSKKEINDLLKSWIAISLAFAIVFNRDLFSSTFLSTLLMSSIVVGGAFLLHEMGHKFMAQKYNYWAEFRSFDKMLLLAILMSFLGFVFAAPGAVMIHGYHITKEKNGKISAAGPLVNFILALFFIILLLLGINHEIVTFGIWVNILIGLFNMIPFGNFDGKKILSWDKKVYYSMLASGFVLLFIRGLV